jgi:hypothetical protein
MPERIVHDDHDDDAVVVDRGGGSSMGVVLGVIVVLLIVAAVWWFALGPGTNTAGTGGSVNVNLPGATVAPDNDGGNGANPTAAPGASY